ncbi:MAG: hypothetical protein IPK00_25105 [Deltaproteobacteria bacterium]|nr:hypothetical protein [Deltaproteobacteria bacterium]
MGRMIRIAGLLLLSWTIGTPARAELPAAAALLADLGLSAGEIAQVQEGQIVARRVAATHERDLATSFAFFAPVTPAILVKDLQQGLLLKVDSNTIAGGTISAAGTIDDFKGLVLSPGGAVRARRYTGTVDPSLNLSTEERSAFGRLPVTAPVAEVESHVRQALLARYQAYHAKGLAGIAPFARGAATRSAADDLRVSLESLKNLQKHAPNAYAAMLGYPKAQPAGSVSTFKWVHLMAHGAPTIVLVHGLVVPDGEAFLVMQRQYYVSEGFNGEQAVAGILPAQGGSIVIYANHTSTDQVAGFGGGAKRSIGSKLMASELEGIFAKLQKSAH